MPDGAGRARVPAADRLRRRLRPPRGQVPLADALRPRQPGPGAGFGHPGGQRPGLAERMLAAPPAACEDADAMTTFRANALVLTSARMAAGMTSRARRPEPCQRAG